MSITDDHPLPWSAGRRPDADWMMGRAGEEGAVTVWDIVDANRALVATVVEPVRDDDAPELDEADTTHGAAAVMQLMRAYHERGKMLHDNIVIDSTSHHVAVITPGLGAHVFASHRRMHPARHGRRFERVPFGDRLTLEIMRAQLADALRVVDDELVMLATGNTGPTTEDVRRAARTLDRLGNPFDRTDPPADEELWAAQVLVADVNRRPEKQT